MACIVLFREEEKFNRNSENVNNDNELQRLPNANLFRSINSGGILIEIQTDVNGAFPDICLSGREFFPIFIRHRFNPG